MQVASGALRVLECNSNTVVCQVKEQQHDHNRVDAGVCRQEQVFSEVHALTDCVEPANRECIR